MSRRDDDRDDAGCASAMAVFIVFFLASWIIAECSADADHRNHDDPGCTTAPL